MKRGGQRSGGAVGGDEVASAALALAEQLRPALTLRLGAARAQVAIDRVADLLMRELQGRPRVASGIRERLTSEAHSVAALSKAMKDVLLLADRFAASDATVLLTGESGSGKERVARRIHERSSRSAAPFVAINCAAMPETLIESELFGYVRGAFTGAAQDREGLFESANGGTFLLDEIGEMPPPLQAKLLRVLQEGEVRRVGATATIKIDVRILAATNRDLAECVAQGTFREDLYYRLRVLALRVPALRERRDDILPLAHEMLAEASVQMDRSWRFSVEALRALEVYDWPGNVRELQSAVLRACVFSSGEEIGVAELPPEIKIKSPDLP